MKSAQTHDAKESGDFDAMKEIKEQLGFTGGRHFRGQRNFTGQEMPCGGMMKGR